MQDNFTGDNAEMLIRYMDGELDANEQITMQKLLENDEATREQYQFFLAAKQAVRSEGIRQRVAGIQRSFLEEKEATDSIATNKKKRTSAFSTFMRVAAVLAFLLIGYGTFQYLTTTPQKVYNDAYIPYQLPVNRGAETASRLEDLYKAGDYRSVVSTYNNEPAKSQKDNFLAGLSYLQLNNVEAAITAFQQLETTNAASEKKMFAQETDYYLMLAYLKAGNAENAEMKLDKILADKSHQFYSKAETISRTKLSILKWKEK